MEKNKVNSIKNYFEIIKYLINPTNYFRELNKKINFYITVFFSALILFIYYIFQDKLVNFLNNSYLQYILTSLNKVPIVLYIIIFFLLIVFMLKNFLFSKKINIYDIAIEKFSIFLMITYISMYFETIFNVYYHINIINIMLSMITLFVIYIIRFSSYNFLNRVKSSNEITLTDILSNNFNSYDLEYLKIYDSDKIDDDLFRREQIIDNLYFSTIRTIENNKSYSIGVVGEWGSGKSSVIELSKKKIQKNEFKGKFIIIDDFDPWPIKSQDSLILAMYNTIIENLGKNIGYFKRKKVQNALISITTNIPYIGKGIGSFFENRIDDYTEYKEIKADLEEKLEKFDKRLIFIIDNLDRMNSENVLFLLTLIGTLFKLPNITYIVAYDKDRINTIFDSDKIDSKYIEKLVNKEIAIPKIHNNCKENIFCLCLKNCIKFNPYYKILEKINKDDFEEISDDVIRKVGLKFDNIRGFIRFLNSILYDINNTILNQWDFLIIKTIEFLDPGLWKQLYKNIKFINKEIKDKEKLNENEIQFFKQIKESNFFDLLQLLSLQATTFYNLEIKDENYKYPNGFNIESDALKFSICNKYLSESFFTHNIYPKFFNKIVKFFEMENNTDFENIKQFFDTEDRYLTPNYIFTLEVYISTIKNDKNEHLNKLKINLFCYLITKLSTYQKKRFDLYPHVIGTLDSLFGLNRELLSEGEEEITEQDIYYCSNTIKNFLQDIKSEDSIISKRTIEFIKEAVENEYNFMMNEIYTKVLKMALEELE